MSGHGLSVAQEAASKDRVVRPLAMIRLDYASAPVCIHNHIGTIIWGGEQYLGIGNFGGMSQIKEDNEVRPNGVSLTLTGIPPSALSQSMGEQYQGRSAVIMVGLCDSNLTLIGDPVIIWKGTMDFSDVELGSTATLTVNCESWLADWQRPRGRRYSHEDQQDLYPGDLGLQFVAAMVSKEMTWGRS